MSSEEIKPVLISSINSRSWIDKENDSKLIMLEQKIKVLEDEGDFYMRVIKSLEQRIADLEDKKFGLE
jgi:hypothetical protein